MAKIEITMSALGAAHEKCEGCRRQFERGEQMSGVENKDGSAAGWFGRECIARWLETGSPYEE